MSWSSNTPIKKKKKKKEINKYINIFSTQTHKSKILIKPSTITWANSKNCCARQSLNSTLFHNPDVGSNSVVDGQTGKEQSLLLYKFERKLLLVYNIDFVFEKSNSHKEDFFVVN